MRNEPNQNAGVLRVTYKITLDNKELFTLIKQLKISETVIVSLPNLLHFVTITKSLHL